MKKTNLIKEAIFFACFFIFLLYWTSPDAAKNDSYTKSLEKVVAKCIDGGAVTQSTALDKRIAELEKELRELRKRKDLIAVSVLINGLLIDEEA